MIPKIRILLHKPKSDSWKHPNTTLLISIASFRDALCPKTLYNIFTKAKYPDRITVNLIQQNVHGKDVDCLDGYCDLMMKDYGECWARILLSIRGAGAHYEDQCC